jgi:hypothetical protein
MKWSALFLLAGSLLAATAPRTFVGVVHDNRCVGPDCATKCPVKRYPVYTLQTGDEAYVLTGAKSFASLTGHKVVVTATAGPDNKLKVISIAPAK